MPRSSKHKSHKQSNKDYSYSDSDEDVKMKGKEKDSLARVSKDSASGEKRKGKDLSGYGNGEALEDYVSTKRRKEGTDRWNGAADGEMKGESLKLDADKGLKGKETKSSGDSKSKNSKREGNSSIVASLVEKEESSKSGRVDSKRKPEKEYARKEGKDSKEVKEKKGQDGKREDGDNLKKQGGSQSGDASEERQNKKEWSIQSEVQNLDLEKESEKRTRKKREVPGDRDKYEDDLIESDDRRVSSRSERIKDERYRHEKHKEYKEDGEKDDRHRDDRYHDDVDKDRKRRDDKYRDDSDRDSRRRDDRYRDDADRDNRRKEDRYREDEKYREKDDKYREYGEKDGRHDDDRYHEDEKDDRQKDNIKSREDTERDKRRKDDKHREDFERHGRCKDGDEADENDKKRRLNDLQLRKSSLNDRSPGYDDRTRYKDELGRRRTHDKEELGDIRSRSSKEQRSEAEKRSTSSARVESDRGRSTSRNADVELTPKKGRWRTSPSAVPHTTRDNYRLSKQEDSKYRDYPYEERIRHGATSRDYPGSIGGSTERISSSRSTEKLMQKDDTFIGDFSAERRFKSGVDRSPSASNERRQLSRSEVRRSLDVEESTQRSGGSRGDVKESRGNRDDAFAGEELSQMDGDNVSVSSPFIRVSGSHLSGSSKSALPPPPPFRSGVENRRFNDPSVGRMQGNAWKGVPNWPPSPMANGFMPFQHGPPPVNFHFPGPPMFGVRPSMDLSHPGIPYHIPDHGRPMGWRAPLEDSCGPPLHGWDASNFGEEAHLYGRPDWDQTRTRSWETSGDVWKGPTRGTSVELQSGLQKEAQSIQGPGDYSQQVQSEQKLTDQEVESNDISQPSSVPAPEDLKINPEEQPVEVALSKKEEEARLYNVYLSKLDISADLTDPELFDQCAGLMDVDHKVVTPDVDSSKILFLEGVVEPEMLPSKFSSASLIGTVTDSVFQKAISLYKKRHEEIKLMNGKKCSFAGQLGESYPAPKIENPSPVSVKVEESALADDGLLADDGGNGPNLPVSPGDVVGLSQTAFHKVSEPTGLSTTERLDHKSDDAEGDTVVAPGVPVLANVKEEEEIVDAMPTEVFEAVMPESIESGSVNLSRIHHSPESTH